MNQYLPRNIFCTIVLFGAINFNLYTQTPVKQNFSFSFRGKYLVYGVIEDLYFRMYTYGGECIFLERHCIGVDATMFRSRFERDDSDDDAMYSDIERRTYILVDYKFLMPVNPTTFFYLNAYEKLNGKSWNWSEIEPYDFGDKDISYLNSTERGRFHEFGIGLGLKKYFGYSNFGIDFSCNIASRVGTNSTYTHKNEYTIQITENIQYERLLPYVRINFFYHFLRN